MPERCDLISKETEKATHKNAINYQDGNQEYQKGPRQGGKLPLRRVLNHVVDWGSPNLVSGLIYLAGR